MLKRIMNLHEEATHTRLRAACERYGALVYPKVRLADILPIEGSQISGDEYRFALRSHFDFVIANKQQQPLFAVEFDGIFHKTETQKKRDIKKNQLCAKFNLPLLRINSNYLLKKYHGMDVLSWLVKVWFVSESFDRAQQEGIIPPDEPFIPSSIISTDKEHEGFYLWLSRTARSKIQKLYESGVCKDYIPSYLVGIDKDNIYRGIAYLRIDDKVGISTETAMRGQQFPVSLDEILEDILVCELYEKLKEALKEKSKAQQLSQINKRVAVLQSNCHCISSLVYTPP